MKNRAITLVIGIVMTAGGIVFNLTGDDVTLANGDTIKSEKLEHHLTRNYKLREVKNVPLEIRVHHTAGSKYQSFQSIAKYHVEQRGYPEIAYHVAVNYKGEIFFLNDIEEITYHTKGNNAKGIGIVLVGNYETEEPTKEMIESVKLVSNALCDVLNITTISGHKDAKGAKTLCPGKNAYNELKVIFY